MKKIHLQNCRHFEKKLQAFFEKCGHFVKIVGSQRDLNIRHLPVFVVLSKLKLGGDSKRGVNNEVRYARTPPMWHNSVCVAM